ncbi:glycosyltransferase [Pelagimonas phthalicica]|nr:glycosyltransferase [Pelagimonas phthalicica]
MSTDPLHITMLLGSVSHQAGGLFNSVRSLSHSLSDANIRVLAPQDTDTAQDLPAWKPLHPITPKRWPPQSLGYAPGISKALRQGDTNIIHQHGIWQAFSAQASAWRKRVDGAVMISPRGMLDPWALQNSGWKKRIVAQLFENENLRRATCLHALNASEAASMRAYGLTNPIAVIPNGITPLTSQPDHPRPALLGEDERKTLLFLGRLHPKKGVNELLQAFALARQQDSGFAKRWRLVVAGWDDGGFDVQPQTLAADLSLGDAVIFPGPLLGEDKAAMLTHSDAFILPSYSEGLPMSVLEAWSYGLPVLMTEACNLPEGFEHNAAWKITSKPEELATQLIAALGEDLTAMAKAGRHLAEQRFTWQQIATRHMAVYHWMLQGGSLPADVEMLA